MVIDGSPARIGLVAQVTGIDPIRILVAVSTTLIPEKVLASTVAIPPSPLPVLLGATGIQGTPILLLRV